MSCALRRSPNPTLPAERSLGTHDYAHDIPTLLTLDMPVTALLSCKLLLTHHMYIAVLQTAVHSPHVHCCTTNCCSLTTCTLLYCKLLFTHHMYIAILQTAVHSPHVHCCAANCCSLTTCTLYIKRSSCVKRSSDSIKVKL